MARPLVYTGHRSYHHRTKRRVRSESTMYVGPMAFRFVTIAAIGVLLTLYVMNQARAGQNNAMLQRLTQQKEDLVNRLEVLKVEEARSATATKTKDDAEHRLGLTQGAPEVQLNNK